MAVTLAVGLGGSAEAQCDLVPGYTLPADGNSTDKAGSSVSISGSNALLGMPYDDDRASNAGAAYVYQYSSGSWGQRQKLTASDGVADDQFGRAVALSGNYALIGAYKHDTGGFSDAGAAYIFRYNGSSWVQQQKLTAFDAAVGDNYGYSLALDGNVAVVGAYLDDDKGVSTGAAYVYRYNGSTWVFEKKLLPPDPSVLFGISIGVSGNVIVCGAYWDDDRGTASGSASVFRYNGTTWVEEAKLLAADGAPSDVFGRAVSISGNAIAVASEADDDRGTDSGSVYIFRHNGASWVQERKLNAADGAAYDRFGSSVCIRGETVVVGAPNAEDRTLTWPRTDQGLAYVFRYQGGATPWVQTNRLVAPDGYYYDVFGTSVAADDDLAGNVAIYVGAPGDARNGTDSGSGYPFLGSCNQQATGCTSNADCNDNNVCTTDVCVSGTCTNSNNTLACNDNNACTTNDVCSNGQCRGTTVTCNDSNPCTDDSCNPSSGCVYTIDNTNACSDGNACTSSDRCSNGACIGTAVTCNDNNPCTDDSCNPASGCVYTVDNTNTCNDGNACTTSDRCSNGQCIGTAITCNDNSPCTDDSCNPATGCVYTVDNTNTCSDGNACTTSDRCSNGACIGTPVTCNDNNPCTSDSCSNGTCVFTNNTAACNDGNACTLNDRCSNGACAGTPMVCNDNNPCTNDSCSNGTCVFTNNTATCNDGDACTTSDRCSSGLCTGTPLNCSDGIACTLDTCANGVCQHDASACGCTSNSQCNDGNPCTTDSCTNNVCVYANNTNVCDDGNPCTMNDRCGAGACVGVAMSCNDGNPCTTDSCANGVCVYANNTLACNDNDPCTTADRCANGACGGTSIACDDGVACTQDYCVNGACVFDAAGCGCAVDADCDDNDPCTSDRCGTNRSCSNTLLANCCGNGSCETGEDACTCSADCGPLSAPECGNGLCEAGDGENCVNCPSDCNGVQTGGVFMQFCCGNGGGSQPVSCTDSRCATNGWECSAESVVPVCCGDGICAASEGPCVCPDDCGAVSAREVAGKDCADGFDNDCDGLKDCDDPDCVADPACWVCDRDGICERGEDCKSCPSDCAGETSGRRKDRFCCGNGLVEPPEVDSLICNLNP